MFHWALHSQEYRHNPPERSNDLLFSISLTVVLLGFAFYLTYRKREVACEDGSCRIESPGRWSKFTVWLAALLAGIAIAFPYFNLTDTAAAQSMLSEQSRRSSNLVVAVLKIESPNSSLLRLRRLDSKRGYLQ